MLNSKLKKIIFFIIFINKNLYPCVVEGVIYFNNKAKVFEDSKTKHELINAYIAPTSKRKTPEGKDEFIPDWSQEKEISIDIDCLLKDPNARCNADSFKDVYDIVTFKVDSITFRLILVNKYTESVANFLHLKYNGYLMSKNNQVKLEKIKSKL